METPCGTQRIEGVGQVGHTGGRTPPRTLNIKGHQGLFAGMRLAQQGWEAMNEQSDQRRDWRHCGVCIMKELKPPSGAEANQVQPRATREAQVGSGTARSACLERVLCCQCGEWADRRRHEGRGAPWQNGVGGGTKTNVMDVGLERREIFLRKKFSTSHHPNI